jgi:hypothetical protein
MRFATPVHNDKSTNFMDLIFIMQCLKLYNCSLYLPNKRRFWNSCALSNNLTIASLLSKKSPIISKSICISSDRSTQTGQLRDAYLQSCKQQVSAVWVCECVHTVHVCVCIRLSVVYGYECKLSLPIDFKDIVGNKRNAEEKQSNGTEQKLKSYLI